MWKCKACTLENSETQAVCDACGGSRLLNESKVVEVDHNKSDFSSAQTLNLDVPTKTGNGVQRLGVLKEIKIINQWGIVFQPSIYEFNSPAALCGYVTCAVGLFMQPRYPLRMTVSEVDTMISELRNESLLVPLIRSAMNFVYLDRRAYVAAHSDDEFANKPAAANSYVSAWVANYECSDWIRANANPGLHFVRHIERGKVTHEELRRLKEEKPFLKYEFFLDQATPSPQSKTAADSKSSAAVPVPIASASGVGTAASGTAAATASAATASASVTASPGTVPSTVTPASIVAHPINTMLSAADWIRRNLTQFGAPDAPQSSVSAATGSAASDNKSKSASSAAASPAASASTNTATAADSKKAATTSTASITSTNAGAYPSPRTPRVSAPPLNFSARNTGFANRTNIVFVADLLGHYVLLKPVIIIDEKQKDAASYNPATEDPARRHLLVLNSSHSTHYTQALIRRLFHMIFDGVAAAADDSLAPVSLTRQDSGDTDDAIRAYAPSKAMS